MSTATGAVAFSALLLLSIGFHEFGHFITARWAGIKVRQFFIGFGPTLWSVRRGKPEVVEGPDGALVEQPETEYGVKLLPLGGFVRIVGMSPFEEVPPQDAPRSFKAAPAWKRAIVLAAGSATHVITAFVGLVLIFGVLGTPDEDRPTRRVQQLVADGPAREAGIDPGDEIVGVPDRAFQRWDEIRSFIRSHPEEPVTLVVRAPSGAERQVTVTPRKEDGVGVIGVVPAFETKRLPPVAAMGRSVTTIGRMAVDFVKTTPKVFNPANFIPGRDRPDDERVVSVVGAVGLAAGIAAAGEFALFLLFFVNVNLVIALFNLLPLPPLDGGHLLVLAVEKIRGRDVEPKALLPVMAVGFTIIVLLGLTLLFQDIFDPVSGPFG